MKVTVYSTKTCSKCIYLKNMLSEKGIDYEVCEDIKTIRSLGMMSVPWLEVGGNCMDFDEAVKWIGNAASVPAHCECCEVR